MCVTRRPSCPALVPVRPALPLGEAGIRPELQDGVDACPGQAPSGALLMVLALPPRYLWTVLHSISVSASTCVLA